MREPVRAAPRGLDPWIGEQLWRDPAGGLLEARGRPARERGQLWGERLLDLRRHVDVREDLIDEEGAHRGLDVLVLEQPPTGFLPVVGVERLPVRPDGEHPDQAGYDRERDQHGYQYTVGSFLARHVPLLAPSSATVG